MIQAVNKRRPSCLKRDSDVQQTAAYFVCKVIQAFNKRRPSCLKSDSDVPQTAPIFYLAILSETRLRLFYDRNVMSLALTAASRFRNRKWRRWRGRATSSPVTSAARFQTQGVDRR